MDSDKLASMAGSIIRGVSKDDCAWVTDAESGKVWDELAASIERDRARFPDAIVDLPNEMPTV